MKNHESEDLHVFFFRFSVKYFLQNKKSTHKNFGGSYRKTCAQPHSGTNGKNARFFQMCKWTNPTTHTSTLMNHSSNECFRLIDHTHTHSHNVICTIIFHTHTHTHRQAHKIQNVDTYIHCNESNNVGSNSR